MLRTILLYLSQAVWAKNLITHFFVARRVAQRFVAGETLDDAVRVVTHLNNEGLVATLDYLGEAVHSEADASSATDHYIKILEAIAEHQLQATISLKLTHLGLDISEDICLNNLRRILERSVETHNHVTIDMESTLYTDTTLKIFRTLRHEYSFEKVGTVIQAYLYRSEQDVKSLHEEGAFIRLCKGAYKEPPDKAFPKKADVDENFIGLMKYYVSNTAASTGAYLGIATHDSNIIYTMCQYSDDMHISRDRFEFQMLFGIRADLQRQLVQQGYTMRVYVPFGSQWYPYFMRRLAERPANLWFFVSNLLRS